MDRLLVSETPNLFLEDDPIAGQWKQQTLTSGQNWRPLANTNNAYWMHEDVIDLEGYTMKDMTAYFRQSFEQRGGIYSVQWKANPPQPLTSFAAGFIEMLLITTAPMTDANLATNVIAAPGFVSISGGIYDYANVNREMIIHGRYYLYGIDSNFGSDTFLENGAAYTRVVQEYDFSSLEPTATDKLYVYRVFFFSDPATEVTSGLNQVSIPPCRILLDTNFAMEEEIPYLMRLKRGYELANQV